MVIYYVGEWIAIQSINLVNSYTYVFKMNEAQPRLPTFRSLSTYLIHLQNITNKI